MAQSYGSFPKLFQWAHSQGSFPRLISRLIPKAHSQGSFPRLISKVHSRGSLLNSIVILGMFVRETCLKKRHDNDRNFTVCNKWYVLFKKQSPSININKIVNSCASNCKFCLVCTQNLRIRIKQILLQYKLSCPIMQLIS